MKLLKSKTALGIALILAGNYIIENFIDDEIDYLQSNNGSNVWEILGFGSANAAMSCNTNERDTQCTIIVNPCDVYNCNEDQNPPRDPYVPPPPQQEEESGGDSGGSSYLPQNPFVKDIDNDRINDCWRGIVGQDATGANLSSDWGWRTINNSSDFHPGWDIGTAGQTNVPALFIGDARVLGKGEDPWNGFWISYELLTDGTFVKYIHLQSRPTANVNQVFNMGDRAGLIGKTGSTSQIHLHLVMYPNKQAYALAVERKIGKTQREKDLIDFNTTIDPATRFKNSVCPFPDTVRDSNNSMPSS